MKSMNRVLVLLAALALLMVGAFAEDAGTPAEVLPAATAAEATAAEATAEEATAAEATPAELADDAVVAIANGIEITRQEVVTYAQLMQSYGYLNSALDYESAFNYMLLLNIVPKVKVAEAGARTLLGDEYDALEQEYADKFEDSVKEYMTSAYGEDIPEEEYADKYAEALEYFASLGFEKEQYISDSLVYDAYDKLLSSMDFPISEEEIINTFNETVEQQKSAITGAAAYEYYTGLGYQVLYRPEGYRGVTHILLKADDELTKAYKEAADDEAKKAAADAIVESLKDKIDEIYARLDNGESFESLIPEYGEDPGMTGDNLQDGYPVHRDSTTYMQEFTDGAFSDKMLNVGDVSDPVVTSHGVHILHYVRDIPGGAVDMTDEMHESICDYLVQTAQSAQIEAWRDELTVEYTDAYNALIGK